MATFSLAPYEQRQYFDDNGDPLAGGLIETYASGTSTPAVTYRNATGTTNTNPIVLDAAGRCIIYLDALSYKFILKNSAGVVVGNTMDPIQSIGLAGSSGDVFEVFEFGGDSNAPVTATSYPSGATVDKTHAGTALLVIDPANIPAGTYVLKATVLEGGGALVSVAIVDLGAGAPDTPLAVASGTSTTGALVTSSAIVFPAGGVNHQFGIKAQVASGAGFVWGVQLSRA